MTTVASSGVAQLDKMERVIADADLKFEEKFTHIRQGLPVHLNLAAERSVNLRQQYANNHSLMEDKHFIEMLSDTEKYLQPEWTLKGEAHRKLEAWLAAQVKLVLQDAVKLQTYASRKIQIDMAYHWYQDKKKGILDFTLEKMYDSKLTESSRGLQQREEEERKTSQQLENQLKRQKEKSMLEYATSSYLHRPLMQDVELAPQDSTLRIPCKPLMFTCDAERSRDAAVITQKMTLYKRRNLSRTEALRQEVISGGGGEGGAFGASPHSTAYRPKTESGGVRVIMKKKEPTGKRGGGGGASDHNSILLEGQLPVPAGPKPHWHCEDSRPPEFRPPLSSVPTALEDPAQEALAQAHQKIVRHMAVRMEQQRDAQEMTDVTTTYAHNSARLSEETARRLESQEFASQAGRTCHTVLRRLPRAEGDTTSPQIEARTMLPSASLDRDEWHNLLGKVAYQGADVSLSPYDHYQPTPLDERRLRDILSKVSTPNDTTTSGTSAIAQRHGLKAPNPEASASSSYMNTAPDLLKATPETAVTTNEPRTDKAVMELLFPGLTKEADVPSMRRLQQTRLVERIRECFARPTKGGGPVTVSRSTIESAILTPDDRPYEECLRLLPRPGSGLPRNPFPSNEKGGKKKGSGKKKPK